MSTGPEIVERVSIGPKPNVRVAQGVLEQLFAEGYGVRPIAAMLGISPATVGRRLNELGLRRTKSEGMRAWRERRAREAPRH